MAMGAVVEFQRLCRKALSDSPPRWLDSPFGIFDTPYGAYDLDRPYVVSDGGHVVSCSLFGTGAKALFQWMTCRYQQEHRT
jgi:hypothetical protein